MIIEKNIPIGRIPSQFIPFDKMHVGDSIYFEKPADLSLLKHQVRISSQATYFVSRHQHTWKFSCRRMDENGIRMWRIR